MDPWLATVLPGDVNLLSSTVEQKRHVLRVARLLEVSREILHEVHMIRRPLGTLSLSLERPEALRLLIVLLPLQEIHCPFRFFNDILLESLCFTVVECHVLQALIDMMHRVSIVTYGHMILLKPDLI